MGLRIALNGFGRIGRCVARLISRCDDLHLVAVNDLTTPEMMAYLLANDSVHGAYHDVELVDATTMRVGKDHVTLSSVANPLELDFGKLGVDVVIECSGLFLSTPQVAHHLDKGVKQVIISAPAADETPTYVLGVNAHTYQGERIISNASCTTNCLGPIAKLIDEAVGISKGLMTTVHSYTNDQSLLDVKHRNDRRRARAAAANIIPTTTGAAKAIGRVLPNLSGKLHGQSVRVPVPDVSMVDLTLHVNRFTTAEEINALFVEAAEGDLRGILSTDGDQCVSQDFVNNSHSGIVALDLTQVIGHDLVKVMAWYDNEWGYSNRLIEMIRFIFSIHNKESMV